MSRTRKEELSKVFHEFVDEYKRATNASRERRLKELRPGESAPDNKPRFYQNDIRQSFAEWCEKQRAKVDEIIAGEIKELDARITAPPSDEATNAINLFTKRNNIDKEEVSLMFDRYGNNVQSYNVIRDFANEHGVRVNMPHPDVDRRTSLLNLRDELHGAISLSEAERGYATDGIASMVDLKIDGVYAEHAPGWELKVTL